MGPVLPPQFRRLPGILGQRPGLLLAGKEEIQQLENGAAGQRLLIPQSGDFWECFL